MGDPVIAVPGKGITFEDGVQDEEDVQRHGDQVAVAVLPGDRQPFLVAAASLIQVAVVLLCESQVDQGVRQRSEGQ